MKRNWQPDHLYIATDGVLFKIGITTAPKRRILALGRGARYIKVWHRTCQMVREIEGFVKDHFADVCVHGEWFRTTEDEIISFTARAVRIEDDDLAIFLGREPSRRCDQPFVPPSELPWLETMLRG